MNEETTNPFQDSEFAFVVVKSKDGEVRVVPFPESEQVPSPPSLDDVHFACHSVVRNIDAQFTARMVQNGMMQAAEQMKQQVDTSKLVVPNMNMRPKR